MRAPLTIVGGKGHMWRHIVPLIPEHVTYAEPCREDEPAPDLIERARRTFVRYRQSFSGTGSRPGTKSSWGYSVTGATGGMGAAVSRWIGIIEQLGEISQRLRKTQIEGLDAVDCIERYDSRRAFFYVDPPYVMSTRTGGVCYEHELTDDDHRRLAKCLNSIDGQAMVSGYPSALYDEIFEGWERREFNVAAHAAKVSKRGQRDGEKFRAPRRTECLWVKPIKGGSNKRLKAP